MFAGFSPWIQARHLKTRGGEVGKISKEIEMEMEMEMEMETIPPAVMQLEPSHQYQSIIWPEETAQEPISLHHLDPVS